MDVRRVNQRVLVIGDGGAVTVKLTQSEWRLYQTLAKQPDRFVPYEELCLGVLGFIPAVKTKAIQQHAMHLRRKMAKVGIECCFGMRGNRRGASGYRWSATRTRAQGLTAWGGLLRSRRPCCSCSV